MKTTQDHSRQKFSNFENHRIIYMGDNIRIGWTNLNSWRVHCPEWSWWYSNCLHKHDEGFYSRQICILGLNIALKLKK